MPLVTLDQAKQHLRVTTTAGDEDLQLKLLQAEAHIVGWCSTTAGQGVADTWTSSTVPPVVTAAILIQTAELDRFRGATWRRRRGG